MTTSSTSSTLRRDTPSAKKGTLVLILPWERSSRISTMMIYSAPDRLSDQISRLRQSEKSVTGYSSMLFSDGQRWWKYKGAGNYAVGTSLCYKKDWWRQHRFPAKQVGEDGDFVRAANENGQLVTADAGELMVASIHLENTSPRRLSGDQWVELTDFTGVPGFRVP